MHVHMQRDVLEGQEVPEECPAYKTMYIYVGRRKVLLVKWAGVFTSIIYTTLVIGYIICATPSEW